MTALQDLKDAEAKLGQSVSSAVAKLAEDANKLAIAQQNTSVDDSADLTAMAQDLAAKAAALDAAVNPGQGSPQATSTSESGANANAAGTSDGSAAQ